MDRHIPFEACFNFRDLGGYRTSDGRNLRWRRLFRSDAPHFMTPDDLRRAREELRIATVIDLRPPPPATQPRAELTQPPTAYHNVPLMNDEEEQEYNSLLGQPGEALRYAAAAGGPRLPQIFATLANQETYPVLVHCRVGKDRSGIVAALVLSVLGVDDDEIADDFALSKPHMIEWAEHRRSIGWGEQIDALPDSSLNCSREEMEVLLETLRAEHGSAVGFLEDHGVTDEDIAGLHAAMIEAP